MRSAVLLNRVLDTLHLRISRPWHPSHKLVEEVQRWRRQFEIDKEYGVKTELRVSYPGFPSFTVKKAKKPYEFVLVSPEFCDVRIWNVDRWASSHDSQTGQLYIDFRSVFLQHEGLPGVHRFLVAVEWFFYQATRQDDGQVVVTLDPKLDKVKRPQCFDRVARADLAVDVQLSETIGEHDLANFISRAKVIERQYSHMSQWDYEEPETQAQSAAPAPSGNKVGGTSQASGLAGNANPAPSETGPNWVTLDEEPFLSRVIGRGELETLYFGRMTSPLYARLYNKGRELDAHGKQYMREVWFKAETPWDGVSPVWRVEFSISGDFLRSITEYETGEYLALREFAAFERSLPTVWAYCTRKWLRHAEPNGDRTHTTRWETSAWWSVVQLGWEDGTPASRRRPRLRPNLDKLMELIKGCLVSAGAQLAEGDRDPGGMLSVVDRLRDFAQEPDALAEQAERRLNAGWDDHSLDAAAALITQSDDPAELTLDLDQLTLELTADLGVEWNDTAFSAEARRDRMREGYGS